MAPSNRTLHKLERLQKIASAHAREWAKQVTLDELNRFSPPRDGKELDLLSKLLERASPRKRTNPVEILLEKLLFLEESRRKLLSDLHPSGLSDDKPVFTKEQWTENGSLAWKMRDAEIDANRILKDYPRIWTLDTTRLRFQKGTAMNASSPERSELQAVAFIMGHISEDGTSSELWRFKRCKVCKWWLYADRKNRYCCGLECRRRTPEAKKKRNAEVKDSREAFSKKWLILPAARALSEGRPRKGKEIEFVTRKVNAFRRIERAKNPAFKLQTSGGQHSLRRAPEPIFQKSVTRNWNAIVAASKSPDLDKHLAEMKYWSDKP
jgi:hypothetical protein